MKRFMADDYRTFFHALTGFAPLPFQEVVAEHMLQGRNMVITAPTGSGKTWAIVAPYLYTLQRGEPTADRLLYALPLRSLAGALFTSLQKRTREFTVQGFQPDQSLRMQSGDAKDDPFFQGRITFTTLDQLLSGYLTVPVSLSDRLGNINVGALVGASAVFDEVHLLEPAQALGTALEMGKRLNDLLQITLMTATLPQECIELLCRTLNAAHVPFTAPDLDGAPHLQQRERRWTWVDTPLTAGHVLKQHKGDRSLVICNSVARAQRLYDEIATHPERKVSTRIVLLHSRFLPEDRASHQAEADEGLSRDATRTDIIAVTTQVVEAGIDWGADTLHTELAPANALVQRAGRCARFPHPRNRGEVYVYDLLRTEQGERAAGPYRRNRDPDPSLDATAVALQDLHGTVMDEAAERVLVERIHKVRDLEDLQAVVSNLEDRSRRIERELFDAGNRSVLSELVRDVDSVNVVVTSKPEHLELERGPISVSVPRISLSTLRGAYDAASGWRAKQPEIQEDGTVVWRVLSSFSQVVSAPWYVALDPAIASYSHENGLNLGVGGAPMPKGYAPRPPRLYSQYSLERWTEHAERVAEQASAASERWRRGAVLLERRYGVPSGTAARLLRVACQLHDFGKLSRWWQDAMQGWQRVKNPVALAALDGAPVAHTDFDPHVDAERQRKEFPQPPHAMEGAYGAADAILTTVSTIPVDENTQNALARCVASAIGRHHGPRTANIGRFTWEPTYSEIVDDVLESPGATGTPPTFGSHDASAEGFCAQTLLKATEPDDRDWLPLYWFLVRNLRLADQSSQAARREG